MDRTFREQPLNAQSKFAARLAAVIQEVNGDVIIAGSRGLYFALRAMVEKKNALTPIRGF